MGSTVATREYIRVLGGTLARRDRSGGPPFIIQSEPTVVGRAAECGFVLDDPKVSAAHLELTATSRGVRARDLGSRNGTLIDGHECVEQYLLRPAIIQCGDSALQFIPAAPVDVEAGKADFCSSLVGTSEVMKRLFHRIRQVAATDFTALITGETGTGKELVARAIHESSPRARGPFVVVDCGSLPASLAESELFGHERGAFTGALERRLSPFARADGGTIFLDEVGELPIEVQPKLLRVVQERSIKPVGSNSYQSVNVRIVAATRRDLGREINTGGFRSDLYFRLAQVRIEVPPLRARREDIGALVAHIANEFGFIDAAKRVSPESLERLSGHDWPGNVRELRNVVAAGFAFAVDGTPIVLEEHLSAESRRTHLLRRTTLFKAAVLEFERAFWQDLLASCAGNVSEMQRVSGVARSTVREYLWKHGLRGNE
jgi:DNA-binding NtrC family response regulator